MVLAARPARHLESLPLEGDRGLDGAAEPEGRRQVVDLAGGHQVITQEATIDFDGAPKDLLGGGILAALDQEGAE